MANNSLPEFSTSVKRCYNDAQVRANAQGRQMGTSHFLVSILEYGNNDIFPFISRIGANPDKILKKSKNVESKEPKLTPGQQKITAGIITAVESASSVMKKSGDGRASLEVMIAAFSNGDDRIASILADEGVSEQKIVDELIALRKTNREEDNAALEVSELEKYGQDLTALAKDGKIDPVIGRDQETRRVMQILARRTKNNPVVIGDGGVGKTAIVEGLARRIASGDCPEQLRGKTIYSLDLASLSAGAKYAGEYEERIKAVLKEIGEAQGNIITFIDEIHMIASDTSNPMNLSNMLKPMLARGQLRLIGATTPAEYRQFIEADPALDRRFQLVNVPEPTVDDTIGILRGIKEKYENHHGIKIQDNALVSCAELSKRYISGRFLPDKAIDLMDEAASRLKMLIDSRPEAIDELEQSIRSLEIEKLALEKEDQDDILVSSRLDEVVDKLAEKQEKLSAEKSKWENMRESINTIRELKTNLAELEEASQKAERDGDYSKAATIRYEKIPEAKELIKQEEKRAAERGIDTRLIDEEVTSDVVADVVSAWTGVPANKMTESETERVLTMGDKLSERVVGQNEAVQALVQAIKRSRAGVTDPNRPIGSFLFAGPSGTGKTEVSKALAEFLYDDESSLITYSMEEYSEKAAVNKLVGSPAGYVGYGDTPALERVRQRPSSVVLFDELEKADDQVIITLLGILEEGNITLNNGKEVDFTNTVIIFTSNLGAGGTNEEIIHAIRSRLRPEFVNRIDAIIPFNALTPENLEKVVDIQVGRLQRTMERKKITFETTPQARTWIAHKGYDPAFGARPVRRIITGDVSDILADDILHGIIEDGDHVTIDVNVEQDRLVLRGKHGVNIGGSHASQEDTPPVDDSEDLQYVIEDDILSTGMTENEDDSFDMDNLDSFFQEDE